MRYLTLNVVEDGGVDGVAALSGGSKNDFATAPGIGTGQAVVVDAQAMVASVQILQMAAPQIGPGLY